MILHHTINGKHYHTIWTEVREWSTAICYDDMTRIKVRRTGLIMFESESGEKLLRTTAKAIQETEAA